MGCVACKPKHKQRQKASHRLLRDDNQLSSFIISEGTVYVDIQKFYSLHEVIGRGHFGNVRKGYSKTSVKKPVAIKSIPKDAVVSKLPLLERELETLMTVDHPNILKIYEVYEDESYMHIVTELCTGGELLDQIITKQRFSEGETAALMYQLFYAVSHLHSLNISHRDIKPENILFSTPSPDSEVQLIDFGLSKKFSSEEILHSIVGTPYFLAPEILKNQGSLACDVWSLGVIMYMLLSGKPPFPGDSAASIFENIRKGEYSLEDEIWSHISSEAKSLLTRILTVDPSLRISAADALEHPWLKQRLEKRPLKKAVLRRLKSYREANRFKKEVIKIMVRYFTCQDTKELNDVFRELDCDHSGYILTEELHTALKENGNDVGSDRINDIVRLVDSAGNGKINYSEFLTCAVDEKLLSSERVRLAVFKVFDSCNEGFITPDGIKKTLRRFIMSDEKIDRILKESQLADRIEFEAFNKIIDT